MVGLANPVHDSSQEEIAELDGITMVIPEDAQDTVWLRIVTADMVIDSVRYTYNGDPYNYRTAVVDSTEEDISGMYYDWTHDNADAAADQLCIAYWNDDGQGICNWCGDDGAGGTRAYCISMTDGATKDKLVAMYGLVQPEA